MNKMEVGYCEGDVKMMRSKAEIDTSAPFRSVKEAVTLFGERVLAGELYSPNKLKQMQDGESESDNVPCKLGIVTAELEETKQRLQKAREESLFMATCLSSLEEELERTTKELENLKNIKQQSEKLQSEIEDLKFVEDMTTKLEINMASENIEFQKKRYVTFENPPILSHVVNIPKLGDDHVILQRHPSLKKKKKKSLIPYIGGIFSRKKSGSQVQ
ncbi:WEB family protein At1g75720-like [Nicotiana tabacum]|uniref:WEB family protein At1g75720-like n=2 Tax=Nicotiana TaxID=4085 RepID=A0A1S4DH35_TOBAC|nr:PREDICTED: WEB family protein At1g75720-like [Nicotiana sylvestris]XP_016512574.1 PREDICTED: WEB family protein At1g75720-like [Nicotiana tabacum]